jgi:hypothetical protein
LAEFEHNRDRVSVAREGDKVLELIDVRLYILFALEVVIRFELHECCGGLVDNLYTTQTPEYSKGKYNVKIIKRKVSPKVSPTTYVGWRLKERK